MQICLCLPYKTKNSNKSKCFKFFHHTKNVVKFEVILDKKRFENIVVKQRAKMSMSFIDFCSGIGGGRLGLELNGCKCLGFSEIDIKAIETYKKFFDTSKEVEFGDLTKIIPQNLPDFDILISGFPCQSFSIVGKREGLENKEKGQIIFHLAKILQNKQPKYFILENVKGLVNHNQGQTLVKILNILQNCNYRVSYQVLNSLNFNLAQSRERVYFIGIRKDLKQEFDFSEIKKKDDCVDISKFLSPNKKNIFNENSPSYETFLKYIQNKYNKNRINLKEILQNDFLVLDTRQSDLRLYENKIPTLRRDRQGILYVYERKLYRLSALEALKFQGFHIISNLKEKINTLKENDILKQCGNAMSVNVIQSLAKELLRRENG